MALPLANPFSLGKVSAQRPSTRVRRFLHSLQVWHLASLDAPSVAVAWTLGFAWAAGLHLDYWVLVLIATGTWTAYVCDRVLDVRRAVQSGKLAGLRERHYFHWRYRRLLIPIACVTAAVAAGLVARCMPAAVRAHDSVLAAAALIYFSGVHAELRLPLWLRKLASKEFAVGLLFTAGCAAPTLTRSHSARWSFFACLLIFIALAWLNCTAIESWESSMNETSVSVHTLFLGSAGLAASAAFFFIDPRASALACSAAVSALLLLLLDRTRTRLSPLTQRTLADLVLMTPLALVILGTR